MYTSPFVYLLGVKTAILSISYPFCRLKTIQQWVSSWFLNELGEEISLLNHIRVTKNAEKGKGGLNDHYK